ACAQLKHWEADPDKRFLVLAVNVSALQFVAKGFVKQIETLLASSGIEPSRLKLEITESMLLDNVEREISTMRQMKALGVGFSLDDFGTGYSSLQYLKRLPLDQIKIDQSFVRELVANSSDRAIVRTIVAMANSMDLDVIAEGVETEEQRQLLLNAGCTHFQGYLFSKPVPIAEFEKLLKPD
ncbi:MAG: EAL domain-containing protein, partial [Pseudomonadota bacterium]